VRGEDGGGLAGLVVYIRRAPRFPQGGVEYALLVCHGHIEEEHLRWDRELRLHMRSLATRRRLIIESRWLGLAIESFHDSVARLCFEFLETRVFKSVHLYWAMVTSFFVSV